MPKITPHNTASLTYGYMRTIISYYKNRGENSGEKPFISFSQFVDAAYANKIRKDKDEPYDNNFATEKGGARNLVLSINPKIDIREDNCFEAIANVMDNLNDQKHNSVPTKDIKSDDIFKADVATIGKYLEATQKGYEEYKPLALTEDTHRNMDILDKNAVAHKKAFAGARAVFSGTYASEKEAAIIPQDRIGDVKMMYYQLGLTAKLAAENPAWKK